MKRKIFYWATTVLASVLARSVIVYAGSADAAQEGAGGSKVIMKTLAKCLATLTVVSAVLAGCLHDPGPSPGPRGDKDDPTRKTRVAETTSVPDLDAKYASRDQYSPDNGVTPDPDDGGSPASRKDTAAGGPPIGTYECIQLTGDYVLANEGQQPTSGTFFGYLTLFEDGRYEEAYTKDASDEYTASGDYTHDSGTDTIQFTGTFERWGWSGEYIAPQTGSDRHAVVLRGEEDGIKTQIWCGEED